MFQETAVKIPFYEYYFANGTEKQSTSSLTKKNMCALHHVERTPLEK
jgi:hypothetical protein